VTRRVLIILAGIGAVAALAVLGMRFRLEARYRSVDIVLDGGDWTTLIRREGRDAAGVLREVRQRGATAVALSERTLKNMAEDGIIGYAPGGALRAQALLGSASAALSKLKPEVLRPDAVYVAAGPDVLTFVTARMRALVGDERVKVVDGVIEVRGTQLDLEELGLGFRPEDAAPYQAAGLAVVVRPRNYRGLTPASLKVLVDSYAEVSNPPTLIFALTEVQGYEGVLDAAAEEYRRVGARFGRLEVFTARRKQKGEDRLTALIRPDVIRVFSLTPEELQTLRPADVVDKFVRAAQERNLRILYLRPLLFTPAGVPALDVNLGVVEDITSGLHRLGFTPSRSRPLEPLHPPAPLLWLVAVGAAALSLIVLTDLARVLGVELPGVLLVLVLAGAFAGTAVLGRTGLDNLWRQLLALGVAIMGGTGAAVWALPRRTGRSVMQGYATLLRAAAAALLTGLFVAALLSKWEFMLALSVFLGVKPAHIVPVALVAVWVTFAQRPPGGWRAAAREMAVWFRQPLLIGAAVGVLAAAAAGVLILARTGNVNLPLSGVEQQVRTTLESVLVARPRTKEFLVGYPALVLAGVAASLGWKRATLGFGAIGAIGTVGLVNSFSHIHTPLIYTVWRTGNALALGALVAVPGVLVLLWIARRTGS
jgi:hypothetical protein